MIEHSNALLLGSPLVTSLRSSASDWTGGNYWCLWGGRPSLKMALPFTLFYQYPRMSLKIQCSLNLKTACTINKTKTIAGLRHCWNQRCGCCLLFDGSSLGFVFPYNMLCLLKRMSLLFNLLRMQRTRHNFSWEQLCMHGGIGSQFIYTVDDLWLLLHNEKVSSNTHSLFIPEIIQFLV